MSILSVDLAANRYKDIGVAILNFDGDCLAVDFIEAGRRIKGRPCIQDLSSWLSELADANQADVILIDGPQGWKDPANGFEHARRCERELATPGKTGLPGCVKPGTWTRMASFSIDLFNALGALGFSRLFSSNDFVENRKLALESFPTAAWRTMGLKPLPGKSRTSAAQVTEWLRRLEKLIRFELTRSPTHDELQALVAGLAGVPLLGHQGISIKLCGSQPTLHEGTWREGFIVNPTVKISDGVSAKHLSLSLR